MEHGHTVYRPGYNILKQNHNLRERGRTF